MAGLGWAVPPIWPGEGNAGIHQSDPYTCPDLKRLGSGDGVPGGIWEAAAAVLEAARSLGGGSAEAHRRAISGGLNPTIPGSRRRGGGRGRRASGSVSGVSQLEGGISRASASIRFVVFLLTSFLHAHSSASSSLLNPWSKFFVF